MSSRGRVGRVAASQLVHFELRRSHMGVSRTAEDVCERKKKINVRQTPHAGF